MLMLLMAQTTEGTGKEDREALDRLLIEIAAGSPGGSGRAVPPYPYGGIWYHFVLCEERP